MADANAVARLRADLGDGGAAQAFTDAELGALLDNAGGDHLAALRAGLWQLRALAAKQVDYSDGMVREQARQWFENLGEQLADVDARIAGQGGMGHSPGTTFARVQAVW